MNADQPGSRAGISARNDELPPHDPEAEESLLGAMLLADDATAAAIGICGAADFYQPRNGHIFGAIVALFERGDPIDAVTVRDELDRSGLIEAIGDPAVFVSLLANCPTIAAGPHYAKIVARLAKDRKLLGLARELSDAARSGDPDRQLAIVHALSEVDLADKRGQGDLEVQDLADLIAEVDAAPAPRYLFRPVMAEGDYGVIAAEDKSGKTWFCGDGAVSVASGTPWLGIFPVESPGPVLMFVGEGGKRKVVRRMRAICASRGIDFSALPIRVCLRVPHLTSDTAMALVEKEIAEHHPALTILDPLYLAARGARGSDLYEMGSVLEGIQAITQRHGAALLVAHHHKKTGTGRGAERMSGVGPSAWGRVLISAMVVTRHTDPSTQATTVTLELDFQGDEIAETTIRLQRRIWADDPDDLASVLHYEVTQIEQVQEPTDPALAGLRPAARRVLAVLEDVGDEGADIHRIGDFLAVEWPLKVRTIQSALKDLREAGLVTTTDGLSYLTRAHPAESEAESEP